MPIFMACLYHAWCMRDYNFMHRNLDCAGILVRSSRLMFCSWTIGIYVNTKPIQYDVSCYKAKTKVTGLHWGRFAGCKHAPTRGDISPTDSLGAWSWAACQNPDSTIVALCWHEKGPAPLTKTQGEEWNMLFITNWSDHTAHKKDQMICRQICLLICFASCVNGAKELFSRRNTTAGVYWARWIHDFSKSYFQNEGTSNFNVSEILDPMLVFLWESVFVFCTVSLPNVFHRFGAFSWQIVLSVFLLSNELFQATVLCCSVFFFFFFKKDHLCSANETHKFFNVYARIWLLQSRGMFPDLTEKLLAAMCFLQISV